MLGKFIILNLRTKIKKNYAFVLPFSLYKSLEKKNYCYLKKNAFLFSTLQNNKNPFNQNKLNTKKQNFEQIPILKQISQLKNEKQLIQIYKKLHFMTKQHRQIALKYLLSAIYTGKVPLTAIQSQYLNKFLNQFMHLKMQSQLFLINNLLFKLKKEKNQNDKFIKNGQVQIKMFNKINDLFFNIFTNTLKQLSQQHLNKNKAFLYKHFAQYNFQFLFDPLINNDENSLQFKQNLNLLNKSRNFLVQSLVFHKQIILSQYKRLQAKDLDELKEKDKQRYYIKINAIKQNIRKLIQSMSQCLYAIVMIAFKQFRWTKNLKKFNQNKLQASTLIQSNISLYSLFSGIKPLSKLYFKLRSIAVDCKYTAFMAANNDSNQIKQKLKESLNQNMTIYKQCQDYLPEVVQNFDNLKQLSAVMLNLKYKISKSKNKNSEILKKQLALVIHDILQKVKPQWKKPSQLYLSKLLKQILKKQENLQNSTV